MNKNRGVLLASFITTDDPDVIDREVHHIIDNFELTSKYIFVLRNLDEPGKKIITYNASNSSTRASRLFTMRVHRKKQTNTLYTINALNHAVAEQHGGKTGKGLKLDWTIYENTILLTQGKKLQTYPIEVIKIYKLEEPPEEN